MCLNSETSGRTEGGTLTNKTELNIDHCEVGGAGIVFPHSVFPF